jgi:hypothetical protein
VKYFSIKDFICFGLDDTVSFGTSTGGGPWMDGSWIDDYGRNDLRLFTHGSGAG